MRLEAQGSKCPGMEYAGLKRWDPWGRVWRPSSERLYLGTFREGLMLPFPVLQAMRGAAVRKPEEDLTAVGQTVQRDGAL